MATTTNYGWTTPDDTALVKDGASAIRTLGSSVDTSVKALNPGTTSGDLDYYTAATTKARIAKGTAGQVFTMNSGATAPEWATPSSGSMTLLSTTTISNQASVSLTSISGSYLYLVALVQNYRPASDGANLNITLNNDTGTSYFTSFSNFTSSAPTLSAAVYASGVDNGTSSAFAELKFFNYANTTTRKYFEFRNLDSNSDDPTIYQMNITRGYWGSTSAINRIDFGTSSGNITSGTILLYGVK